MIIFLRSLHKVKWIANKTVETYLRSIVNIIISNSDTYCLDNVIEYNSLVSWKHVLYVVPNFLRFTWIPKRHN